MNDLADEVEAVCIHPDCPDWLREAIWDAFADQRMKVVYSNDHWRAQLQGIAKYKQAKKQKRKTTE